MAMNRKNDEKRPAEARALRQLYLRYELKIKTAEGYSELYRNEARTEYELSGKKGAKKSHMRKYLIAKSKAGLYDQTLEELRKSYQELQDGVESALSIYDPVRKKIWLLYFIRNLSVADVSHEVHLAYGVTRKWVAQMWRDMVSDIRVPIDSRLVAEGIRQTGEEKMTGKEEEDKVRVKRRDRS